MTTKKNDKKEEEKLEIEDIKEPEYEEGLDIESAISEEPEVDEDKDHKEETTKIPVLISKEKKAKKGKGFNPSSIFIVIVTAVITAAVVFAGAFYYFKVYNKGEENKEVKNEGKLVEESKEDITPKAENVVYVSEKTGLRLRKEANASGEVLATMPYGTKLTIKSEENGWIQVDFGGKTGWCAKQYTQSDNPLVYTEPTYGFKISFPAGLSDYKLFKANISGTTATYYVAFTTTDKAWKEASVDSGYASLFAVSVYTQAQWSEAIKEEATKPSKLGEKGSYVFGYSHAQAAPKDFEGRMTDMAKMTFEKRADWFSI